MRITCDTKDTLPLSELTEFQGGLKKRSDDDLAKIERSIEQYGFATPFFIWKHEGKNKVLDGHGRLQTLKAMQAKGEVIPDLPVVYINLPNEEAAKNLLLRICSTYGEMTAESVLSFIGDYEVKIDDIRLPSGCLNLSNLKINVEDFGTDFSLADGDIPEICTITFTLHRKQKELIEHCMEQVRDNIVETFENSNENGNALYEVVREWAELKR